MGIVFTSELQGGGGGRCVNTLLTARADQLYLNFLGGGEGLEYLAQVQVAQGCRRGAGELVMGVDFTVVVIMLVFMRIRLAVIADGKRCAAACTA